MRKMLTIGTLATLLTCCFFACSKKSGLDDFPDNQNPPVFNSYEEAGTSLQQIFQKAGLGEQLVQVEHIVFLESGNKSYALVYYESSRGHRNIVFEHTYQGGTVVASKTYECLGGTCDCKVVTSIGSGGEVNIECSCSSCTMIENSN